MAGDLSNYLAERYLVADPKPTKKRKRKQAGSSNGLLITDDDDATWGQSNNQQDDDADDGPLTVSGTSAEFRKTKKSGWKTLAGSSKAQADDGAAAADAILSAAAAEAEAAKEADDEMPIVEDDGIIAKMSDGTHAGLQSAASVAAQLKRRQREEKEEFDRYRKEAKEEETVYRDATGRRIDVSMRRAEARRAAAAAEEKARMAKEDLKGEVQQREARQRRENLDDAKLMPFARKADDIEINKEMKDQQRWNDPMTQFMSEKQSDSANPKTSKRRPIYTGAAPPNRYNIKPGYRWDGVDRGNGFEAERFRAINRREMNKGLDYAWQMDE